MFLEFIAAIAMAFAGGGTALIAQRLTGGRLPGWIVPAAAGAGMLGYIIWSEYTWAARVEATLPDRVEVVSRNSVQSWYRPWTYAFPLASRMIVMDHRATQRHPEHPGLVMKGLILRERWALAFGFQVLFDCNENRRADLSEGVTLGDDGLPGGLEWFRMAPDDPVLRAACDGG